MLFAQFVNLNNSQQTNGSPVKSVAKEEILYKASRGSIGNAFNEPEDNSRGGALPYKPIRDVTFFRISFFSINS